jgi:importin subunit alpha-1
MKRRQKDSGSNENNENMNASNTVAATPKFSQQDVQDRLKNISYLVQTLQSDDVTKQLEACTEFRKLLSVEKNPPIQQVIDTGIVPRLVQMLQFAHNDTIQFEAAWTLTNIASGTTDHTKVVIAAGAIPQFIALLRSPSADVQEQAVWALGNIAGDSPTFRDYVLDAGGVGPLLEVFKNHSKMSLVRNATWTLSNLCRGKPQPPFEKIAAIVPMVSHLVRSDDIEVLTDSCWALSYISDDQNPTNQKIQAVIDSGAVPRMVQCLQHHSATVQVPALRCIGNIVTGDDLQTQEVLRHAPLNALHMLMSHRKKSIRKEACWTISNITAGNPDQIQQVVDANIIPPLVGLLRDSEFDIQKEAAWAISNATSGGNDEQIKHLVECSSIPALSQLFKCQDPKVIQVALEGMSNILLVGKREADKVGGENKFATILEECYGLDYLEELQHHENQEIYEQVVKMLREYFDSEEDDDGTQMPGVSDDNQFVFGLNNQQPAAAFSF